MQFTSIFKYISLLVTYLLKYTFVFAIFLFYVTMKPNHLQKGFPFMNIKEIAKLAGVSVATVSRVINTPSAVSDKTRERVQKIMEEQNYKPNVFARGLNAKSTNTVGILCPEMNDINHAKVISILERLLRSHGFDCLLYCTGSYLPYSKKNLELLAAKQVAAILAVGSACDSENDKAAFRAVAQQIPVIVLNGLVSVPGVYNIFCDEERAVRDLTAELIRSGCRSLYFIEDNSTFSAHQKRSIFALSKHCASPQWTTFDGKIGVITLNYYIQPLADCKDSKINGTVATFNFPE